MVTSALPGSALPSMWRTLRSAALPSPEGPREAARGGGRGEARGRGGEGRGRCTGWEELGLDWECAPTRSHARTQLQTPLEPQFWQERVRGTAHEQ